MTIKEVNRLVYGDVVKNKETNEVRQVKSANHNGATLDDRKSFVRSITPANCHEWTMWIKSA